MSVRRVILVLTIVLSACTITREQIQPITKSADSHPSDSLLANDWAKYKNEGLTHLIGPRVCGENGRKTAVFVTLSGGGSRAAFFAARILHELDSVGSTPITPNIDGIFAVSGGGIAAALYGISHESSIEQNGPAGGPIWSQQLTDEVLTKSLIPSMVGELMNPMSLSSYLFGELSRTDLLEKSIEKNVFLSNGASPTFRDLNPGRPPIFLITAIATSEGEDSFAPQPFGSLFIFAKPDLAKIGDDLNSVALAKAVSASAAFPGLLSPVTLPRYRLSLHETQLGKPRFLHLIDGGNADNLGLLGVKRALLENDHRLLRECESVVVLTVDAFGNQGVHNDTNNREMSPVGWFFDHKSALASFDALLAANRARLLGEFKSRVFMPPGSEELCRKDGLPDDVCGGGVRADWDGINRLIKQKLYFVHVNFDSPEMASQKSVRFCKGSYPSSDPQCEIKPVDGFRLACEQRRIRRRIGAIPTTFGLSDEQAADLRLFASMLNHPKNVCLNHLWDVVSNGVKHNQAFYEKASASCDETPTIKRGETIVVKAGGHVRGRIFGDVIVKDANERLETFEESCERELPSSHKESIKFLYEAKAKLIASPQFLKN